MFSCYLIVKKERDRDEKVRGYEKKKSAGGVRKVYESIATI